MHFRRICSRIVILSGCAAIFTICIFPTIGLVKYQLVSHSAFAAIENAPAFVQDSEEPQHGMNLANEPIDWWAEILERHGHVGPWNVLGYRMGKAILREMGTHWGDHSLTITCHVPLATPYSCLVDGIAVGTGNSQGRLDLRIGEVAALQFLHISARCKATDNMIIVQPNISYLRKIESVPMLQLESLARECADAEESALFEVSL